MPVASTKSKQQGSIRPKHIGGRNRIDETQL
jgi:hypothetical protein